MKKKGKILLVDDNEEILIALRLLLMDHYDSITTLKNPNLIHDQIQKNSFDVILLDMNFKAGVNTGNEGIFWMNKILEHDPQAVIIFITAYGDVELAVRAIKEGATDFIQKPWDDDKLLSTINTAFKLRQSRLEVNSLRNKQKHLSEDINRQYDMFLGNSEIMRRIFETIRKVAKTDANILIQGENGTGKELIAREIHKLSSRSSEVFVTVDMASLSESLFESELFGHTKGAFTDAREERPGRFEIASGGSLFLDEIGNLPLNLQSKLLNVLQNREITRLGSNIPIPIDIRLISATNKPLQKMATSNEFREDLLYRINTIQIELPPLRHRTEDIPDMINFFLAKYARKYNKECMKVNSSAKEKLKKYQWPGNIRELQHAVEKAVILCDSDTLGADDFFFHSNHTLVPDTDISLNLEENEKKLLEKSIHRHKGNLSMAARDLGITRKTLYNKIKKYGI